MFSKVSKLVEMPSLYKKSEVAFWDDEYISKQIAIITNYETQTYYLWNTYFTEESLIKEANDTGFKICKSFGDVMGSPYNENSFTIAILLEK